METAAAEHRNEVLVIGRLSAEPVARNLPSGAVVTSWRLVVERPAGHPGGKGGDPAGSDRRTVDALECATFREDVARAVESARSGDVLEVRGALRRRFWRSSSGVASRYEIEATNAQCVRAAEPTTSRAGS